MAQLIRFLVVDYQLQISSMRATNRKILIRQRTLMTSGNLPRRGVSEMYHKREFDDDQATPLSFLHPDRHLSQTSSWPRQVLGFFFFFFFSMLFHCQPICFDIRALTSGNYSQSP